MEFVLDDNYCYLIRIVRGRVFAKEKLYPLHFRELNTEKRPYTYLKKSLNHVTTSARNSNEVVNQDSHQTLSAGNPHETNPKKKPQLSLILKKVKNPKSKVWT